ncbi:MAG: TIGR03364 family FAD-dependent oxidoreductase [Bryobacteraceae bacterium]|nr:TIGR03364 family FAD-dependent oxidoreductase [Bryobacteraceae bacterium]
MSSEHAADVGIVGAGILGLAHAWHAARRGKRVVVFEAGAIASGASVRNFGMIWPIGQPNGTMHQIASRSRDLWVEVLGSARIPYRPHGSLHLVYRADEQRVAEEFATVGPALGYDCEWLARDKAIERSPAARQESLVGALWSSAEITVDPRMAIAALPQFLHEKFGVEFRFGGAVQSLDLPNIETSTEKWRVQTAIVCSGDEFQRLFPEALKNSGLTRVKLQMLRTPPQPNGWDLGPALAAGLTLRFYPAFEICTSLPALRQRIAEETPEFDKWGIHGLVSATADGALTLGDSHEYGNAVDIFNKEEIDQLILDYIRTFLAAPDLSIAQRWHGVYAKHPKQAYVASEPAKGVRIVTGVGGSGMTLSFGLAERMVAEMGL